MSGYRVGSTARGHLAEIYAYSRKHWGEARALRYVGGLFTLFERIGRGDAAGRPLPPANGIDLRTTTYREHFVFWRQAGDKVRIVAVLHQRMDHVARLLEIQVSDATEE